MKYKIILLLAFTVIGLISKAQISFELNTRSSKIDTVFDYYFGVEYNDTVFKYFDILAYGSFERDKGISYYQYRGSISQKYFKVSHITDTEKDICISSLNLFLTKKIKGLQFKIGSDLSYTDILLYGAYVAVKYKYFKAECCFNDKLYKWQCSFNPEKSLSKNIKIGIISKWLMVEDSFKWRNGLTLKIKI